MADPLSSLLARIQCKIESRTTRPWYDLQRTYYYTDNRAVKSVEELKTALEHFHVLLGAAELQSLFASFRDPQTGFFDFRAFAERCYPRAANPGQIRDGRPVGGATHGTSGSFSSSGPLASVYSPQGYQAQEASSPFGATSSFGQTQQQSPLYAPTLAYGEQVYASGAGGGYEGAGYNYGQEQQGAGGNAVPQGYGSPTGALNASRSSFGRSHGGASNGARSRNSTGSIGSRYQPGRLTYHPTSHGAVTSRTARSQGQTVSAAQFAQTLGASARIQPHPQAYPFQELSTPGRFDVRPLPKSDADVSRRHNISRGYDRETPSKGGIQIKKKATARR